MRSELDVRSITLIRKALEHWLADTQEPALGALIEQLAAATTAGQARKRAVSPLPTLLDGEPHQMRVVNLGVIRDGSASYAMRLEAGIRSGVTHGLRLTHLVADEALDLAAAASPAARAAAIKALLARFDTRAAYVDRTYLVCLDTAATGALVSLLRRDTRFRARLGRDFRVIFAAVTCPETTGILDFDRDYVGGMAYGDTAVERVRFIRAALPDRPIAHLHDPGLPPTPTS